MKPVAWMVGASVASWLVARPLVGLAAGLELFLGMIGPLAAVAVTWVLVERTYRLHPEQLTSLMIAAFVAKMVFFGAYVAVALGLLSLRPIPFVVSFTSYFIALYLMEALYLRRLFGNTAHASRS